MKYLFEERFWFKPKLCVSVGFRPACYLFEDLLGRLRFSKKQRELDRQA
jgi:hypothetical protein